MLWCGLAGGLLAGCGGGSKPTEPPKVDPLALVRTHPLSISQPSDVTIDESGTTLWMVGNNPERVYQLDRNGTLVKTLPYNGEDLEGIAYDPADSTLWVAEENRRQIVHLDLNGSVLSYHPLGLTGEPNSGLEGVCLNDRGRMFVLNEKLPGLFIELNTDLSIASQRRLDFAGDYSGMAYNRHMACFWIVSDQSQSLYLWNKPKNVVAEYPLPFSKPEGVAFDPVASLVYVVSDATNKLYVYRYTSNVPTPSAR